MRRSAREPQEAWADPGPGASSEEAMTARPAFLPAEFDGQRRSAARGGAESGRAGR